MLHPVELLKYFKEKKINFFCGVPDSVLKNFTNILDLTKNLEHYTCVNEGSAIGLAIGHYLKEKKIGLVYFQNSGLGNSINPLVSIADKNVYKIPMVLLIGWRGSPGIKDEKQHLTKGKITLPILKDMGIKYKVINNLSDLKNSKLINYSKINKKPVAFLIKKGFIEKDKSYLQNQNHNNILRSEFIIKLLQKISNKDRIISSTGFNSRELYQLRTKNKIRSGSDFYMVGGMGHTAIVSLGFSLKNKKKNIICLDGDGSFLMHMGSMVTVGKYANKNYKYILLNNLAHESVGGQKTLIETLDLKKFSHAVGFKNYIKIDKKSLIDKRLNSFLKKNGPNFLEVKIKCESIKNLTRPDNFSKILYKFMK